MQNFVTFRIYDMHCAACEQKILKNLEDFHGISSVELNLTQKKAKFFLKPGADPKCAQISAESALFSLGFSQIEPLS